jgi:spermidine/putrescine transport system permease protein
MKYRFARQQLSIPYAVFLLCFVIAPLLVIVYYAFTNGQGSFSLANLTDFFTSPNTIGTLFYSLLIALTTTWVCLLIAYPVAYILAQSNIRQKTVLLALFIAPMWVNFTLRILALKEVLTMLEGNLAHYPFMNTIIGMTFDFLPFMILPLYTTLMKLDQDLMEAAYDLGASRTAAFARVALPLSIPGSSAG